MTFKHFLLLQYDLWRRFFKRPTAIRAASKKIIRDFQLLYYETGEAGGTWMDTRWLGCRVLKCPLDLWLYQELIHETRPELIIETGTCEGGSAWFMACVCDALGHGQIITIDIDAKPKRPVHPRIEYWIGSSTSPLIIKKITQVACGKKVMIILDSDHSKEHVLMELQNYAPLVHVGGYLIVEDTNLNGHPANPEHGPGPMEAVDEFLLTNDNFKIDQSREKFLMTFNPRGFLLRIK
jgi:cephalosporin hydroxylase